MLPLVSCIMPTANRPAFVRRAIELFVAQDYPNKELIVFESWVPLDEFGNMRHGETLAHVRAAQHDHVNVRYDCAVCEYSIGEARNKACASAHGSLIAHWDDDDWHAPNRLSVQVAAMQAAGARLCGLNKLAYLDTRDPQNERVYLFTTPRKPWLAGGSLMYDKSLWAEQPFTNVSNGEDTAFVDVAFKRDVKMAVLTDPSIYVAIIHGANTTPKDTARWSGFSLETIKGWMKPLDVKTEKRI